MLHNHRSTHHHRSGSIAHEHVVGSIGQLGNRNAHRAGGRFDRRAAEIHTPHHRERGQLDAVRRFGFDLVGGTPADFAALIRSEAERWTPVVKTLGIRVD